MTALKKNYLKSW